MKDLRSLSDLQGDVDYRVCYMLGVKPRGWLKMAIDENWKLVKMGNIREPGEVFTRRLNAAKLL